MAQIGPESEEKENGPRDGDENDGGVSFFDFALLVVGKSEEEIGYDVHDEENRAKDDERNVQTVENDHRSWATHCKGVFLVKMKNAFVPVKRVYSVNTYSRISTVLRGSEQNE